MTTATRNKVPTQTDRVLAVLESRARTGHGVNETEFGGGLGAVVDGGKPIRRVAARIHELRESGYAIDTVKQSNGTATYILTSGPIA